MADKHSLVLAQQKRSCYTKEILDYMKVPPRAGCHVFHTRCMQAKYNSETIDGGTFETWFIEIAVPQTKKPKAGDPTRTVVLRLLLARGSSVSCTLCSPLFLSQLGCCAHFILCCLSLHCSLPCYSHHACMHTAPCSAFSTHQSLCLTLCTQLYFAICARVRCWLSRLCPLRTISWHSGSFIYISCTR